MKASSSEIDPSCCGLYLCYGMLTFLGTVASRKNTCHHASSINRQFIAYYSSGWRQKYACKYTRTLDECDMFYTELYSISAAQDATFVLSVLL